MEKQPLTLKNIRSDLLRSFFGSILYHVITYFIFLGLFLFYSAAFKQNLGNILAIVISCVLVLMLGRYTILIVKTFTNKFRISKETLIHKEEGGPRWNFIMGHIYFKPYELYFYPNIKYKIRVGQNYKWSVYYAMSEKQVFNSCYEGDEFYVISMDKIVFMAYNMRLFKLK